MSLETRITALAQAMAADVKTLLARPAGGSATIKTAVIDIGGVPKSRGVATVTDAAVTPASRINVMWGAVTDADENDPEMDDVTFHAVPGSGQFTVRVTSSSGHFIRGAWRINYLVG